MRGRAPLSLSFPLVLKLLGALFSAQHNNPEKQDCQDRAHDANHRGIHHFVVSFRRNIPFRYMLFIMGSSSRTIFIATGPTVTTNSEGRMQKKIGKTSFTPNLAAFSSAIWRAWTRI
jgi:hypothetical protein